ncbi:rRNA biogenesis protein rrp36 [Paramecium bursaria]
MDQKKNNFAPLQRLSIQQKRGGPVVRDARMPPSTQIATKQDFRDPRFEATSGELNSEKFYKSYSFLQEQKQKEIQEVSKALQTIKNPDERSKLKSIIATTKDQLKKRDLQTQKKNIQKQFQGKNFFPKKSLIKETVLKEKFDQLEKGGKLDNFMASKKKRIADKLSYAQKKIK